MSKDLLSQYELKTQLHYNHLNGIFIRLVSNNDNVKIGDIAGSKKQNGYIVITVNNKSYKAHRLAWLYMHGYFPENDIDHKYRIRHHNWIDNLRESSRQCNLRNRNTNKNNTSGIVGVYWHKRDEKWNASITVNKIQNFLGYFPDKTEAAKARWKAEVKYGFPNCNTVSTSYLYLKENNII